MNRSLTVGLAASAAVLCTVWMMQGRAVPRAPMPEASEPRPDILFEPDIHTTGRIVGKPKPEMARGAGSRTPATIAPRAVAPLYTMPSDPAELRKRFFGEEADAIAKKWQAEPVSPQAREVEAKIFDTYGDADARDGVHAVACHSTLCRIDVDKRVALEDHEIVKRMAGKLGAVGWLQHGSSSDQVIAFVPIDFKPLVLETL